MKILIRGLLLAVVIFILFTWWALEADGVAVIETTRPNGSARSTHVWFAERNGDLWLEAGTPENGWYADVQANSTLAFSAAKRSGTYTAQPVPGDAAHQRIRSLLREKYGLRDWWIGVLFDTTRSLAVRLVPERSGPP